ncbi:MAG: cytoskeletal protein CcmA (bactofilin family) [Moritella sp.]|jgi:cytoskeletal protein CcmA (bactofilin family)
MFSKKKSVQQGLTFISKSCSIMGELDISGDILLDGQLNGSLKSDSTITVGTSGNLIGLSSSKRITISGSVAGDLECDELHIEKTGVLRGNIICNSINIDNGGQFFGQRLAQAWTSAAKLKNYTPQDKMKTTKEMSPEQKNTVTIENNNDKFSVVS